MVLPESPAPQPDPLPPELEAWRRRGRWVDAFGLSIFAVDEGPPEAETLVVLHGFPTFSWDFHRVLPALAERFRVILHDHPGFGLSDKPTAWSYSLVDQADVALEVWRRLGVSRAHLLAHDYGTSIATELLARRERGLLPLALDSVTLSNGSVHLEMARLRLSQRLLRHPLLGPWFARRVSQRFFCRRLSALFGDPERVDRRELEVLWAGVSRAGGVARAAQISSYLGDRLRFAQRWIPPLTRLDLPAHVLWGRRDPVAVAAIAERLAEEIPGARLGWLPGLGHYPMLEDPRAFSRAALEFWRSVAPGM